MVAVAVVAAALTEVAVAVAVVVAAAVTVVVAVDVADAVAAVVAPEAESALEPRWPWSPILVSPECSSPAAKTTCC